MRDLAAPSRPTSSLLEFETVGKIWGIPAKDLALSPHTSAMNSGKSCCEHSRSLRSFWGAAACRASARTPYWTAVCGNPSPARVSNPSLITVTMLTHEREMQAHAASRSWPPVKRSHAASPRSGGASLATDRVVRVA
ncbi:hypothetical protein FH972_024903 [Carpinus fangiana]|uniref:Uncharacterized protein n=1 Tax=Carpinus fangiana TaxID=176857 RepID=A0A5N6KZU8_9ROSI|nr:hypothetical protein FH972_024903 [Carpinus fangiana]